MGQSLNTFSVKELENISLPGKAVPALFWIIPIGSWEKSALDKLWNHFTRSVNICSELGLMLIKDEFGTTKTGQKFSQSFSNLSDLTAMLKDVLPAGVNKIYDLDKSPRRHLNSQLLILSGAYPQPGWSVLLNYSDAFQIDKLINNTVNFLGNNLRDIFLDANKSHYEWEECNKQKPDYSSIRTIESMINLTEKLFILLNNISSNIKDPVELKSNLKSIHDISFEIKDNKLSELIDDFTDVTNDRYLLSIQIQSLLDQFNETEINDMLLKFYYSSKDERNILFQSKINREIKSTASNLLKINNEEILSNGSFVKWSSDYIESNIINFKSKIEKVNEHCRKLNNEFLIEKNNFIINYENAIKEWKKDIEEKKLIYHLRIKEVVNAHWEYGPQFLVKLELLANKMRLQAKSIAWDPARMIGWKILCHGMDIKLIDLQDQLSESFKGFISANNKDSDIDIKINGSYFTDYVHYISISNLSKSIRIVTHELLKDLLRKSEILKVLICYNNINKYEEYSIDELIDTLLIFLGWPEEKLKKEITLAQCLIENNGKYKLNTNLSGNEIRVIIESFCKDIIDTLTSKLGLTELQLWDLLFLKFPQYIRSGSWNSEINNITIGKAHFIIETLAIEVYPDKKDDVLSLSQMIITISVLLNKLSHHPVQDIDKEKFSEILFNFIELVKVFINEMPWHFFPIQKNGYQPSVLTGKAWSHSHKETRQLSIILWNDLDIIDNMLIYNPTLLNPVIADPVIINRP